MQNEIRREVNGVEDKTRILKNKIQLMQDRKYNASNIESPEKIVLNKSLREDVKEIKREACPICQRPTVIKTSNVSNKKFYVCSGYPGCMFTKPLILQDVSIQEKAQPIILNNNTESRNTTLQNAKSDFKDYKNVSGNDSNNFSDSKKSTSNSEDYKNSSVSSGQMMIKNNQKMDVDKSTKIWVVFGSLFACAGLITVIAMLIVNFI